MIRTRPLLALLATVAACSGCGGNEDRPPQTSATPPAPTTTATATATTTMTSTTAAALPKPPPTPKKPVVDTVQGVSITDDYRWLEAADDAQVKAWSNAQNAYARSYLDARPGRDAIKKRVSEILTSASSDYFALRWKGKKLFAMKLLPPKQQPFLVTMKSADDPKSEQVVLDPNVVDPKGGTTIDWYVPSLDGKLVAVSLSEGGSERGSVHVYDVATGQEKKGDLVPHAQNGTAGGSVAWNGDGSGFFYTRYPRDGERPAPDLDFFQQIHFHKLGTDTKDDVYALGKDFPRIAEVALQTSHDGKYVLATVENGDGGEFAHYLHDAGKKSWTQVATYDDKVIHAQLGKDGALWLLSRKGAPKGKLLKLSPQAPQLEKAKVIVAESDVVIDHFATTASRLYVVDLVGGPSKVRSFDLAGKPAGKEIAILPVSHVGQLVSLDGDDLVFSNENQLTPSAWYRFDAKKGASTKTALFQTSPADFSDAEVVTDTCISNDQTKVPITILQKKGAPRDGSNPTVLYGYGGYGVSLEPWFDPSMRVWLDQGGVFAVATLRGGGEFGESWHLDGNLTKKQHVFDDFLACARHLVATKVTSTPHLAAMGASNGGLLMGAAMTQGPELFTAIVARVGIYDMLRVELTPNGAFNVTEFGTVKDKAQFDALYAYSPYHHVKDGQKYPAILFMTGENDPRVDPYNSRKMVARLQAANGASTPILLRTSGDTGHGMGTPLSAQVEEDTDFWSFLADAVGKK